jgi:hypothetical protein
MTAMRLILLSILTAALASAQMTVIGEGAGGGGGPATPTAHATTHQNGGSDQMALAGLGVAWADVTSAPVIPAELADLSDVTAKSGTGTVVATVTGTLTPGNCLEIDVNVNIIAAGGPCPVPATSLLEFQYPMYTGETDPIILRAPLGKTGSIARIRCVADDGTVDLDATVGSAYSGAGASTVHTTITCSPTETNLTSFSGTSALAALDYIRITPSNETGAFDSAHLIVELEMVN